MERISPNLKFMVNGTLIIYSAPSALRTHIEWAIQGVLGAGLEINWRPQINYVGTYRCEISWRDLAGNGAKLSSALASWYYLRFEIFEVNADSGELFRFIPELGIKRNQTDGVGNILLTDTQINQVLTSSFEEDELRGAINKILGKPWEDVLEPLRALDQREVAPLKAI